MSPRLRLSVGVALGAATLAGTLAACSGSGSDDAGKSGSATHTDAVTQTGADARVAAVTLTAAKGCTVDKAQFPAGGITFKIVNKDATAVSEVELLSGERIVGEKENIPPGFSGEFAVTVPAGTYTLYCPGAATERSTIKVTGKSAATGDATVAALLKAGTEGYAKYVDTQVAALLVATAEFAKTLHGSDLAAAQAAYMKARPFYEKIEPVAESFVIGNDSIDADIDVREGDVPASQWRGFHRIEKALFEQKTLAGMGTYGDKLVADVKRLQQLTTGLTYQPTELANGAQELLDEVASSKITGEEERYSHIDLLDFDNNDEGAQQAFAQLQPALQRIDPALTATIAARFAALDTLVDTYRTTANPSGFKLYTQLTAADKRSLAAAVKAVQEPLSKVASKVANA
ncbi:MAG TPA: iron uptake system protein EfeO [Jatrophihabitans sp.]|nr:iron uptake system protein EfeO [Jatrophihabitans sp.]